MIIDLSKKSKKKFAGRPFAVEGDGEDAFTRGVFCTLVSLGHSDILDPETYSPENEGTVFVGVLGCLFADVVEAARQAGHKDEAIQMAFQEGYQRAQFKILHPEVDGLPPTWDQADALKEAQAESTSCLSDEGDSSRASIVDTSSFTSEAKVIFGALLGSPEDDQGSPQADLGSLSDATGVPPARVLQAVKHFQDAGLVVPSKRGRGRQRIYTVVETPAATC